MTVIQFFIASHRALVYNCVRTVSRNKFSERLNSYDSRFSRSYYQG